MWLVVGLGNPTERYAKTRHNVGFRVVDAVAGEARFTARFDGAACNLNIDGTSVVILKPLAYMNVSGRSVRRAADFYKVPPQRTCVVHDDLDLSFGDVRLKRDGGEAGHNGLKSISRELGTRDYLRLRVGIGRPPKDFMGQVADFVLQAFAPAEEAALDDVIQNASSAIRLVLQKGFDHAMNEVNRRH